MKHSRIIVFLSAIICVLSSGISVGAQQPLAPAVAHEVFRPLYELKQTGMVRSLAIAPDGKTLAVATRDEGAVETMALWNLQNGQLLRSWKASAEQMAFAPDGKTLAGADKAEVVLWSIAGEKQKTLAGPAVRANSLQFSPDGKTLVIGGSRKIGVGELWIWDLATNTNRVLTLDNANGIEALAFSSDSTFLAVPKVTGLFEQLPQIGVWEVTSLRLISTLRDENIKGWINGLTFSPGGKTLVSAHNGHQVVAWDTKAGTLQSVLLAYEPTDGPPNSARSVAFSSDGRTLLISANKWNDRGEGGELLMGDWATHQIKRSLLPTDSSALRYFSTATALPIAAGASNFSSTVTVWRLT